MHNLQGMIQYASSSYDCLEPDKKPHAAGTSECFGGKRPAMDEQLGYLICSCCLSCRQSAACNRHAEGDTELIRSYGVLAARELKAARGCHPIKRGRSVSVWVAHPSP